MIRRFALYAVRQAHEYRTDAWYMFLHYPHGTVGWAAGNLSLGFADLWYDVAEALGESAGEGPGEC